MFGIFKNRTEIKSNSFVAVASGEILPLAKVKDDVFSKKMLGDGVAIKPNDDFIVAPCDGTITMLFPTLHAFGIKNDDGVEALVHIGIDTVNLKGRGFKCYVKQGDRVKVGDKIIKIDSYDIENNGYDLTTMLLFPNQEKNFEFRTEGYASRGKTIVTSY